jgi:UDP-N-acetylmuramate--alanine ligase
VRLHCPMLHRSDLLFKLMEGYKTLAVTGTHGKTTTTALLAAVLKTGQMDPTYAVGGVIKQFHSNAEHGEGEYFVAEADESDGTFLKYRPYGGIITNIGFDHMNYFGTEKDLCNAFQQFAHQITSLQHLLWCGDDVRLQQLGLSGISYGIGKECTLRVLKAAQIGWHLVLDIEFRGALCTS